VTNRARLARYADTTVVTSFSRARLSRVSPGGASCDKTEAITRVDSFSIGV
jgi:hypothetical protein